MTLYVDYWFEQAHTTNNPLGVNGGKNRSVGTGLPSSINICMCGSVFSLNKDVPV